MLNLQKVLTELKTDKINLVIDAKLIAGARSNRWSGLSGVTAASNFTRGGS